jgi:2-hydroxychromene-2-carboxylate isomerase
MTAVEVYVDPSCPWAWITCQWLREIAPARNLELTWRSYCLEIRDDYDVAPTVSPEYRDTVIAAHAVSHRMLRVFEAARARAGEPAVDALFRTWGPQFFVRARAADAELLTRVVESSNVDVAVLEAADDTAWDTPIVASMEVAYAYGGPKTQTPTLVVREDPPFGFKGPVMAPAPTGEAALRLWDAIVVLGREPGVFEFMRPRAHRPSVRFG